jgi:hypothetical protein
MPVSSSLQLRILRKCITFARTTQHFHRKVKIIFRISHKMLKISSEVYSFLQLLAISGQYSQLLHERHNATHTKNASNFRKKRNFCKNNPKSCSTFSRTTQKVRREDFAGFEMSWSKRAGSFKWLRRSAPHSSWVSFLN